MNRARGWKTAENSDASGHVIKLVVGQFLLIYLFLKYLQLLLQLLLLFLLLLLLFLCQTVQLVTFALPDKTKKYLKSMVLLHSIATMQCNKQE